MFFLFHGILYPQVSDILNIEIIAGEVNINSKKLIFEKEKIISILGTPDRVEKITKKHNVSRKNIEGTPDIYDNRVVEVEDTYLIYDKYGLIFCTSNGIYTTDELTNFIIFFKNKREFDNKVICDFEPVNKFKGVLKINRETVQDAEKIIPENITFKTDSFNLYMRKFGTACYVMQIDMIYSFSEVPNIEIYLNNGSEQKVSCVLIKL